MHTAVTPGLSMWYPESSTAVASSSKERSSSPNPLSESLRVKHEIRTPFLSYWPYPDDDLEPKADTHRTSSFPSPSLIHSPPLSRLPRRPPVLQPPTSQRNPSTATLYPPTHYIQPRHPQHVSVPRLNSSFSNDSPDTAGQHGTSRLPPTEHYSPSCTPSTSHGSINSSPWSTHPVFTNPTALAAHHGLPQSLPPVPRTTRYLAATTENPATATPSSSSTPNDFQFLCNNYLNMLAQKPVDPTPAVAPSAPPFGDDGSAAQAVVDMLLASPEFQGGLHDFGLGYANDYLTSPLDESPWEDMLTTPALGNSDSDFLTSPAIVDADDFGFGGAPLFDESGFSARLEAIKTSPPVPVVHHPLSFDGLYTMPSPTTPSLDPSSLDNSATATPITPALKTPGGQSRRKNAPTGTRKNITPEALVPFDAPIQPRKYITPSATSRKEIPAVFAKKRSRSMALGDDDELGEEDLNLNPGDVDAIEAKRRQNTLAARRSRKRKLEYQRELEASVEKEKEEKDYWRDRAAQLETLMRQHGLEVPT